MTMAAGRMVETRAASKVACSAPVLSMCWIDGSTILCGCCDNKAYTWNLTTNALSQVAEHKQPVKCVAFSPSAGMCITGGWDGMVLGWDGRAPSAVAGFDCRERVYCMSVSNNTLLVGLANLQVAGYQLPKLGELAFQRVSPLKLQTRCIQCFPNEKGFLIGALDGRIGVEYFEANIPAGRDKDPRNYTFRAHRDPLTAKPHDMTPNEVYPVNDLAFYDRAEGIVASCGGDGRFHIWDAAKQSRLYDADVPVEGASRVRKAISSCSFSGDGSLFAYAVGSDFAGGPIDPKDREKRSSRVMAHVVTEADVKSQKKDYEVDCRREMGRR